MCVSRAHCNMALFCVMLQCRPGTVKKAVFVTVPGLQRTMSGREDAPKLLMLRCARDTQLTHLFLDRPSSLIFIRTRNPPLVGPGTHPSEMRKRFGRERP